MMTNGDRHRGMSLPRSPYGDMMSHAPAGAAGSQQRPQMQVNSAVPQVRTLSSVGTSGGAVPASALRDLRVQTRFIDPAEGGGNSNSGMRMNVCGPESGAAGMSEVVIKLIAQSAAATSTIQSISAAGRKNLNDFSKNASRRVLPVLAQAVQGASTFGSWEVNLGQTFPNQRVTSMEIGGWTLPASQWTVESNRTNIAVTYGTYFDIEKRRITLSLGGGQSGVQPVTVDLNMPLQKAECYTVRRILDRDGFPTGLIRFIFPYVVSSYIKTAALVFENFGASFTLQALRGSQSNFILEPELIMNNNYQDTFIDYMSQLLDNFIDASGLWITVPDPDDPAATITVMKPRTFGTVVLPQCILAAPAVPSAYQLADLITEIGRQAFNDDSETAFEQGEFANQFSFAMNYRETADRFAYTFGITASTNQAVNRAVPQDGANTPLNFVSGDALLEEMGFGRIVLSNSGIDRERRDTAAVSVLAQAQRVHPPLAYYRVRPGVYPDGRALSAAVNDAFDAMWFGPQDSTPDDGNAPPFVLTFRKSNGLNVYARVKSGRYFPDELALAVQLAVRRAFVCDTTFPCPDPDCLLSVSLEVVPIFVGNNSDLFAGLAFSNRSEFSQVIFAEIVTFEMAFDAASTTINPQDIGYQRRLYSGSSVYCPDACGSQPDVYEQVRADRGLLQIETTFSNPIAQEFLNVRRIPRFPVGVVTRSIVNGAAQFVAQAQAAPFRLRTVFDEQRRHMSIESVALPPMHNCLVLCEDQEAAVLLLETPIAHGIPPGTIVTINVSAGAQFTGQAGVTPGMGMQARDELLKLTSELLMLWANALTVVQSLAQSDPDSAANADGWMKLINAVMYGFRSVQGYQRWTARIKPYLRNFTTPISSQLRLTCFFFDNGMIPIADNMSKADVEMAGATFASPNAMTQIAQEYVCQVIQTAADIMYAPVYPVGSQSLSMCYYMFVTLQAVLSFPVTQQAAVRTNAVVIEEPVYNANSDSALADIGRVTPDSMGIARSGIALIGGLAELRGLEAVAASVRRGGAAGGMLDGTGPTSTAQQDVRQLAAQLEDVYNVCRYVDKVFYQCERPDGDDDGGDIPGEPAARARRSKRSGEAGAKRVHASGAAHVGKRSGRRLSQATEQLAGSAPPPVPPATARLPSGEARSNMDAGIGESERGMTAAQALYRQMLEGSFSSSDKPRSSSRCCGIRGGAARRQRQASRRPQAVTDAQAHSVLDADVDDFDVAGIRDARKQAMVQEAIDVYTDVVGDRRLATQWILELSRTFGLEVACAAAVRKASSAGVRKSSIADAQQYKERVRGGGVPYDCSNGAGTCPPLPDPGITERAFSCFNPADAPFTGQTGDELCLEVDEQGFVKADALVPKSARLLLIVGTSPVIPGACPSWPFSETFNTNVRVAPACSDIYEVNFRDPPPNLSVIGDGPPVPDIFYPAVLGYEPVPCFSFGFRVLAAPNVVTLTGYPYALLNVSIENSTDILANGGYGGLINYPGRGDIVTPQRVLTQAVFFGSVAAGEMDKRLVVPMDRITKVQRVVVQILSPDGRPINFHGQNATVLIRLVTLGTMPNACL